ncbi:hypothetical protein TUE45_02837 [Streptomyces reticuli]|nr:hypothetical protein TUE45_02837 [Streptomyces reticuli]
MTRATRPPAASAATALSPYRVARRCRTRPSPTTGSPRS